MQYGIKSRPYLVFLHFGAEKGYVLLSLVYENYSFQYFAHYLFMSAKAIVMYRLNN